MLLPEKQFGKTFVASKDEFEALRGEVDLDGLERARYVTSQIELIKSRLDNLIRMIQNGDFDYTAEETIKKLDELENKIRRMSSRADLYVVMLSEAIHVVKGMGEHSQGAISISDLAIIMKKYSDIEKRYGVLATPRLQNIFISLVETAEILSSRIKNLEMSFSTIKDIRWSKKVKTLKEGIASQQKEKLLPDEMEKQINNEADWVKISQSLRQLRLLGKQNDKKRQKVENE